MSTLTLLQARSEDQLTRTQNLETALLSQEVPQAIATPSAAIIPGKEQIFLTYAGISALTLANPVAGAPISGGLDGATLVITDTKGYAHTVTTGANGINGAKHIVTFSAALGSSFTLRAYNGSWWMQTGTGVTLS
jgi:hypothetical protein